MKFIIAMLLLLAGSTICGQNKSGVEQSIMLPNPGLMRCDTSKLWQDEKAASALVYPVQTTFDHFDSNGCPRGIVAVYGKDVSQENIRAALDRHYGKWSKIANARAKVYRVEPEKFAIQVSTIRDSLKETGTVGEEGMQQVIYLSFYQSK